MSVLVPRRKYTRAQVALAERRDALGSWEAVAWEMKKRVGYSVTAHTLMAWFRRHRTPSGMIKPKRNRKFPTLTPPDRHLVNLYLGIDDPSWWEWSDPKKPTPPEPAPEPADPYDTSTWS